METTKKSVFETLQAINCNGHAEQKNGLTYLSWPYAWSEVKKVYPDAEYEVVKFDGKPYVNDDTFGIMVYTKVTIQRLTHEMWLPVMDSANNAMKSQPYTFKVWDKYKNQWVDKNVKAADMFDINKAIMRCLVKNLGMFGCGLYIYAGEDLPFSEEDAQSAPAPASQSAPAPASQPKTKKAVATKKATPKPQEPTKITPEAYYKTVAAAALDKKTNDGLSIRDWYVQNIHPTDNMLLDFDDAVMDYKKANNIL